MEQSIAEFEHPAWLTAIGTAIGYSLVLLVLFVGLFVLPLVVFVALG